MPSYAQSLSPSDLANLLQWLRSNLAPGASKTGGESKKESKVMP
jgi:hypothetical protein